MRPWDDTGGAYCNQSHFGPETRFAERVPSWRGSFSMTPKLGGLLAALPREEGEKFLLLCREVGIRERR